MVTKRGEKPQTKPNRNKHKKRITESACDQTSGHRTPSFFTCWICWISVWSKFDPTKLKLNFLMDSSAHQVSQYLAILKQVQSDQEADLCTTNAACNKSFESERWESGPLHIRNTKDVYKNIRCGGGGFFETYETQNHKHMYLDWKSWSQNWSGYKIWSTNSKTSTKQVR